MAKCALCGFDLDKAEKKPELERGRQWAQSIEVADGWVCGSCRDEIRDRD